VGYGRDCSPGIARSSTRRRSVVAVARVRCAVFLFFGCFPVDPLSKSSLSQSCLDRAGTFNLPSFLRNGSCTEIAQSLKEFGLFRCAFLLKWQPLMLGACGRSGLATMWESGQFLTRLCCAKRRDYLRKPPRGEPFVAIQGSRPRKRRGNEEGSLENEGDFRKVRP
jgi:hypothetical protein